MAGATATTSFRALGTTALLVTADGAALAASERILRDELDAVNRACSRFREDSELSRVNRGAGVPVPAGPLLREAITAALHAARDTAGDVDPTIGDAMAACGYDRDFARIGDTTAGVPRVRVTRSPRWRAVVVDDARGTVRVPAGTMLDLGATAKALAADRAARAIHAATGTPVLVSLGGDIALAGPAPAAGWPVRVSDDHRRQGPGDEVVEIRDGGLATSSTAARRWGPRGSLHHIMDPRTGAPAPEAWRTVSVAARTCLEANVASTAAIVRGRAAPGWLAARGLPARLVAPDGAVTRVAGWPEPRR